MGYIKKYKYIIENYIYIYIIYIIYIYIYICIYYIYTYIISWLATNLVGI